MKRVIILASIVFFSVGCSGVKAASASDKKDVRDIIGSSHVIGRYNFTDKDFLNEGADKILELGSKVIKVWFYNGSGEMPETFYPYNSQWPKVADLAQGAKVSYYKNLFDKPFSTIIMNVATFDKNAYYWFDDITAQDEANEEKQFYDLTCYLLKEYAGSGKTFVLQHHEGDWHLRGNTDKTIDPAPKAFANMIKWLNARQRGVDKARKEVGQHKVKVYHATEVNLVVSSMKEGRPNLVNKVLPYVNVDMVSYSAYDAIFDVIEGKPDILTQTLDYIAANTKDHPDFGNKNVYIGEFGIPENNFTAEQVEIVMKNTVERSLSWGCPYIVYWQLYCNELIDPATKTPVKDNKDVRGFWLIRPDGTKSFAWNYFNELLTK